MSDKLTIGSVVPLQSPIMQRIEDAKNAEHNRHDIEHQIVVEAERMIITACIVNGVNVHQKIIDLLKLWRVKYDR